MKTEALAMAEATAGELPSIAAALADAGLPSADLGMASERVYCFRDRLGALVGCSGLDVRGTDALLRSVLVLPRWRKQGLGRAIVRSTLDRARALGVRRIFLLTTTAQPFFTGLGFASIPRSTAPGPIAATAEFTSLCPTTAVCMMMGTAPRRD